MPYDPKTMTEEQRSYAVKMLWLGLPASILNLGWILLFPSDSGPTNIFGVYAATTMAMMVFAYGYDEFIQAHLWKAAQWTLGAAGLMLLISVFPLLDRLEVLAVIDLTLGLSILASVFHIALALSRWKESRA